MSLSDTFFSLNQKWTEILSEVADSNGLIPYESFSKFALFHPELGYYSSKRNRVGKNKKSDFYTSSSHTQVFPELIADATSSLLQTHEIKCDCFYELGAEPEQDAWKKISLPCAEHKILRLGDTFDLSGNAVVFSNELFDAQPFQRWIARDGNWLPISLKLNKNELSECVDTRSLTLDEEELLTLLPDAPGFEYHLDVSIHAKQLLETILNENWKGLFIAIDYGKKWQQLIDETPQGTARAYHQHKQSPLLHHNPGEQDLTTHVCWDHLTESLMRAGFEKIELSTQSRFLMEKAKRSIESIVSSSERLTSKRKSQLLELISPGFFGQRFQVLTAVRK